MSNWERLDDILTEGGKRRLSVGQVMTFNFEGSLNSWKIMRIFKNGHVWARPINLVDPRHYGHDVEESADAIAQYGVPYCRTCKAPVTQPVKAVV